MKTRFFSLIFLIACSISVLGQGATEEPLLEYNYDRCEDHEFGGWRTTSVLFQEGGNVMVSLDNYVIKPQYASEESYQAEVDRISNSDASIMEKLDARTNMYDNMEKLSSGTFTEQDGYLKIYLSDDEILGTDFLKCEIGGRYLQCLDWNFVLAHDEAIINYDVIAIENVLYWPLNFQEEPSDRWIIHIESENLILENGENFQLESLYERGRYLGHGREGKLALYAPEEQGISYDFRFYDSFGEGTLDALDDLKMKPAYFFGDYSYVIGIDQETDNATINKQYKAEENLWYIESAMCDIVDELVGN